MSCFDFLEPLSHLFSCTLDFLGPISSNDTSYKPENYISQFSFPLDTYNQPTYHNLDEVDDDEAGVRNI